MCIVTKMIKYKIVGITFSFIEYYNRLFLSVIECNMKRNIIDQKPVTIRYVYYKNKNKLHSLNQKKPYYKHDYIDYFTQFGRI